MSSAMRYAPAIYAHPIVYALWKVACDFAGLRVIQIK